VRGFEIDRRRDVMFQRVFPSRYAHAPFVARFQSGESPFWMGCHQIVPIQDGEIEEFPGYQDTDSMKSKVFGPRATIAVPVKTG
jgi:hypothetical protein